jgi:uncharacterized protein HemX
MNASEIIEKRIAIAERHYSEAKAEAATMRNAGTWTFEQAENHVERAFRELCICREETAFT